MPLLSHTLPELAQKSLLPLLFLTATASVLAIGSVHTPVLIAVSALSALSAAAAFTLPNPHRLQTLPILLLLALALLTLLQTVPIPIAWLERIAPTNADIWSRALLPLHQPPSAFATISLDPGASTREALKLATYATIFAASTQLGAQRGAAHGLLIVFGSACLAALTTLIHGLLGLTHVYGLYQPAFRPSPWHVGPLLNPNNLAGYLNLGLFSGIGLLFMHNPILPAWTTGLGTALLLAILLASGSRAGVIALLFGLILFAFLSRSSAARIFKNRRFLLPAATALLGGIAFALLGTGREAWLELYDQDLQKLQNLRHVLPALLDFPWLGMGRGAFESVFPAYKITPGHHTYTHAENFVLQWSCEWGIPIALVALLGFAHAFSPRRMGAHRGAVAAAAFTGLCALLLQNMADLGLEVPALCIAASITMGSLYGDSKRRHLPRASHTSEEPANTLAQKIRQRIQTIQSNPIATILFPILFIALFTAPVLWVGRSDLTSDQDKIRAQMAAKDFGQSAERTQFMGELRAAIQRHPAEPYFPLVGALFSWREKTGDPIPWLQRTLERSPVNGRAHLLLADVLYERKAKLQAFMELRLAVENDAALVMPAAESALRYSKQFEEIVRSVPAGPAGAAMLDALGEQLSRMAKAGGQDEETRQKCDEEALQRDPSRPGPRLRQAEMLIGLLDPKNKARASSICPEAGQCERILEEHASALQKYLPDSSHGLRIRARLWTIQGRAEEAEQMLSSQCNRFSDRAECIKQRVMSAAAIPKGDRLNAAVKDYVSASCNKAAGCAAAAAWAGRLRYERGEWAAAAALYERAVREEPTEERYLGLAEAAGRAGAHAKAADALQKVLQKKGGGDAELKKRIEEERAKAAGILVEP